MGIDYAFTFEPARTTGEPPTDAEVAAYYEATKPPGSPPLEMVREHVSAALVASRALAEVDPVRKLVSDWEDNYGRDPVWVESAILDALKRAGRPSMLEYQQPCELDDDGDLAELPAMLSRKWHSAADGLATLEAMQAFVASDAATRLHRREEALEAFELLIPAFKLAITAGRGFRFHIWP